MMKKKKCDTYNESLTKEINLEKKIDYISSEVERFLKIVQDKKPGILNELIIRFKKELNTLGIEGIEQKFLEEFKHDFSNHTILNNNLALQVHLVNAIFTFMNFSKYQSSMQNGKLEISVLDEILMGFKPIYYLASSLIKIIPRKEALELAKQWTIEYYQPPRYNPEKLDTLEEFYAKYTEKCHPTHVILNLFKDNHFFMKINRCMWAEAYKDIDDKELTYYIECYGDFANYKKYNENFLLTRTKTLVESDPYCDFCYRDTRTIKEIKHPNEEFFEKMDGLFE